ncbi:extracellular solute-binding protein [Caballeronia arvi]|uniref:Extracellular solute-binding protein n=1 Tax=Caballeronia arvi TaxID=1777135 RepID=A0A158KR55_9BURK|nr:ABC transporter substrate-binding protein [Caballeronia arvi]SAL83485.1 extracellular solute-binding protein [Caballeronia arvi]
MTTAGKDSKSPILIGRRQVIIGAAALGISALTGSGFAFAQGTPKKGGTLRLGMDGGSVSDSLDPRTITSMIPVAYCLMFWNNLVEIDAAGNATPELAESWESKPGATEWIFNIRKGITFTSGKTLDADDVIYSLNLHRGESKSPAKTILEPIKEMKKTSSNQIHITLSSGNADLPYVFSDYHLMIVPAGTTDFSKPDGTGAYTLVEFSPGTRVVAKRKPGNYWKPGRGNFDTVEIRYIGDSAARTQAFMTGQVDAVNRLDPKTVGFLTKNSSLKIVRSKAAGPRFAFVAQTDRDPFKNRDLMLAMKYGIDRNKIVQNVFSGYATVGNDQPISPRNKYYNPHQIQRPYDPDKATFHFKKSGFSGPIQLKASEGAFNGAIDAAVLFQESLKQAGMSLEVKRVSGDGYWSNVWLKEPFCAAFWSTRPTADLQLSQEFQTGNTWNDTRYANPKLDQLLMNARVEINEAKRQQMYAECQALVSEESGMICFAIGDQLDGCSTRLAGLEPHPRYDMNDNRLAEKGWFL